VSSCSLVKNGDVLNKEKLSSPLFVCVIYADKIALVKLSKRISCAIKTLPLRVKLILESDIEKAIGAGATKECALEVDGKIVFDGEFMAEDIEEIFKGLL
jgi:hypothetical protein